MVAGAVAGWLYDVWAAAQPYDTSGGMCAGGQLLTALGALLVAALPPTLLALAQLLGVPLWTAAFALFAPLAPTSSARQLPVSAVGVELMIAVCAAIHWLVRSPPI